MTDTRQKNADWKYNSTWDGAKIQVLMDLRDELQELNRRFRDLPCIVAFLRQIKSATRGTERQLKMQRRCPKHPRYTAKMKPRSRCVACWRYWRAVWK